MTIAEMHIAFNLELKAQGSHEDFQPEEIDVFLNRAIRSFVDVRKPEVRTNEAVLSDLRTLMNAHQWAIGNINPHAYFDNVVVVTLTDPSPAFEYPVGGRVEITEGAGTWKMMVPRSYEKFLDQISGDDHAPVLRRLPATIEGDSLLILFDQTDVGVNSVHLTYLTAPATVNFNTPTNSDLPAHTHQTIVSSAVQAAIQALANTE